MTREEIIRCVRDYVRDDMAQYAILIDSPWGSGKTYLYEHHLVTFQRDNDKLILRPFVLHLEAQDIQVEILCALDIRYRQFRY